MNIILTFLFSLACHIILICMYVCLYVCMYVQDAYPIGVIRSGHLTAKQALKYLVKYDVDTAIHKRLAFALVLLLSHVLLLYVCPELHTYSLFAVFASMSTEMDGFGFIAYGLLHGVLNFFSCALIGWVRLHPIGCLLVYAAIAVIGYSVTGKKIMTGGAAMSGGVKKAD